MRVLIIIAHPRRDSFSHKIAEAYRDGAAAAGHTTELLDLYQTSLQLDFLQPESKDQYSKNQPIRDKLQTKITNADEIIIAHPLWWGGPPAILKNFIDQIFTPGFAYRPARKKFLIPNRLNVLPQGLLKGRRVRLFVTCDGQRWTSALRLMPYLVTWEMYVFRVSGLKLVSFHLFDYMKHRNDLTRAKWLAKVRALGASKPALMS